MRIHVAENNTLKRILARKRWDADSPGSIDLQSTLKEILAWANRFIPSQAGSIFLDDPLLDEKSKKPGRLYFVTCFGRGSAKLAGTSLDSSIGIIGKTYLSGEPYMSKEVIEDKLWHAGIDEQTLFNSQSIICVPIKIKNNTIGVIELINRLDNVNYDAENLEMLTIFAEYTSTLIQNTLDANRFGELSTLDNLTGLYNDRYFYDLLSKKVRSALRKKGGDLSLIFFDLDRFKEINDTHGHLAGSSAIKEVGELLQGNKLLIKSGATSSRYGGDEFVIILPNIPIKEAAGIAEDIRMSIREHTFLNRRIPGLGKSLKINGVITASMGVASLRSNVKPVGGERLIRDGLIKKADQAMYISKRQGKDTVTISRGRITPK